MTKPLDIDDLFPVEPEIVVAPVTRPAQAEPIAPQTHQNAPQSPQTTSYVHLLTLAAAVFFGAAWLMQLKGCDAQVNPSVKVQVTEPSVLLAWDAGASFTQAQSDTLNSSKFLTWCKDNDVLYRKYEKTEDLTKAEKQWADMMELATKSAQFIIATPRATKVHVLPDTTDEALQLLDKELGK
jgi:hypothetical protein